MAYDIQNEYDSVAGVQYTDGVMAEITEKMVNLWIRKDEEIMREYLDDAMASSMIIMGDTNNARK